MFSHTFRLTLLAALIFPSLLAWGQDTTPISTERPSVSSGPDVISAGSLQIETGATVSYALTSYAADLPEAMIRVGVGRNIELRYTSSNAIYEAPTGTARKLLQLQDTSFGIKVKNSRPNTIMAQAIVASYSLPTGAKDQTSGSFDPSLTGVWLQNLKAGWSFTENVGVLRTTASDRSLVKWLASITVAHPLTPRASWYAEYAPTVAIDLKPLHIFDGGIAINPTPLSQFDIRVGCQNDSDGVHNLASIGYSRRFDGIGRYFSKMR